MSALGDGLVQEMEEGMQDMAEVYFSRPGLCSGCNEVIVFNLAQICFRCEEKEAKYHEHNQQEQPAPAHL
jgi:hypothetical protein